LFFQQFSFGAKSLIIAIRNAITLTTAETTKHIIFDGKLISAGIVNERMINRMTFPIGSNRIGK
jgi:hypothetical protein